MWIDIDIVKVINDSDIIFLIAVLLDSRSDRTIFERRFTEKTKLYNALLEFAVQTLTPKIPNVLNTKRVSISLSF